MYLLELFQDGDTTDIGLFGSIDEGRRFISRLEAYEAREEDETLFEYLCPEKLPLYTELSHNGNVVPFTKLMFASEQKAQIFWKDIPDLTREGSGFVDGSTRVDAYSVENKDVGEYIDMREKRYETLKKYLDERGFEVKRDFFGSEDGEATLVRKKGSTRWHFLLHLDPFFCEGDTDIAQIVKDSSLGLE